MVVSEAMLIDAGVQAGLVDPGDLEKLRLQARRDRVKLIELLTHQQRFPVSALYRALAELRGMPFVGANELDADLAVLRRVPAGIVRRRRFLPVSGANGNLKLAISDPDDQIALDTMKRATDQSFEAVVADPQALETAIRRAFSRLHARGTREPEQPAADGAIDAVSLLDEIMSEAYLNRASDIHLEPERDGMRVRFRIDGRLQEYRRRLGMVERETLMTRVKVLGQLDIAEQRETQDGAFHYKIEQSRDEEFDIRLATAPTRWGERATMRLFGHEIAELNLEELGMPSSVLGTFRETIRKPHGIILVTGPTGSGKTTTLYAALRELNSDEFNILTVEDPIEQVIDGISQVQVGTKLGFAGTLRAFLRHDPDVMLVGEIRDLETADTAMRAALTGHLVLSTLHTNDAPSALTRLVDIGVERYLIGSTVLGVLAQRLVRRLCSRCRRQDKPSPAEREFLGLADEDTPVFRARGCPSCLGSGYHGRVGVFEALWTDADIARAVSGGADEHQIREHAGHYVTMRGDACAKVVSGDTTVDEIRRLGLEP